MKETRIIIEWLFENSLYWTIRNWFSVRKIKNKVSKKQKLDHIKPAGLFRE